ncbi:hypothetical protein TNCV_4836141 [Trichonephila clavipes]|nr:hypothetical protein TNCV_4836141 [Trichonephila clavipes]
MLSDRDGEGETEFGDVPEDKTEGEYDEILTLSTLIEVHKVIPQPRHRRMKDCRTRSTKSGVLALSTEAMAGGSASGLIHKRFLAHDKHASD